MRKTVDIQDSLSDEQILEQLSEHISLKINFSSVKQKIRDFSKQNKQALFLKLLENGHTLFTLAVEVLNVPVVRELLSQGVNPNNVLVANGLLPEPIFTKVLKTVRIHCAETYQLADLFWIHKAIINFAHPFQPTREYLNTQREELETKHPDVFNFNNPALCLCYAVHSALIPQRKGADRGKILLAKMLKQLHKSDIRVLGLVAAELNHEEQSYYNAQTAKVSLSTDHFQCDLLREIYCDETLLRTLDIADVPLDQFDHDRRLRERCRETLIERLDDRVIAANSSPATGCIFKVW